MKKFTGPGAAAFVIVPEDARQKERLEDYAAASMFVQTRSFLRGIKESERVGKHLRFSITRNSEKNLELNKVNVLSVCFSSVILMKFQKPVHVNRLTKLSRITDGKMKKHNGSEVIFARIAFDNAIRAFFGLRGV